MFERRFLGDIDIFCPIKKKMSISRAFTVLEFQNGTKCQAAFKHSKQRANKGNIIKMPATIWP